MKITDRVLINDTLFSVVCVYLSISIMIGSLEIWDRAFTCRELQSEFQETFLFPGELSQLVTVHILERPLDQYGWMISTAMVMRVTCRTASVKGGKHRLCLIYR